IFEKLIFIEENRTSFNYLLKNLSENKIEKRSEYYRASVDKALKSIKISPDVVLMDPPRSGANEMSISQIVSFNPELVIYISCNPSTQIRDFKYFNNKGYKVVNLRPFDFFPQTKHIESVALLQKK
ncbi:MAG: 23S rRNA (Uracil-5-)-methyltransferase RumA, partial [uncultured bacterium]